MESLCRGWPFVGGPHPVMPLGQRWSEETERSAVTAAGWPEGRAKRINPTKSGRTPGARPFAYFWRGRPSGRLPEVTRRKGGTDIKNNTTAEGSLQQQESSPDSHYKRGSAISSLWFVE